MLGHRFAPDHLRDMALAAIEEAAAADAGQIVRTKALRFALAYLWTVSGGERWPFDNFWSALDGPEDFGRAQSINAALNAIYRALGVPRP
jgi:hypothetical protein